MHEVGGLEGVFVDLRPFKDIEAALAAAEEWLPETSRKRFVQGAIDAYLWVLGRSSVSPATRYVGPLTDRAIRIEEQQARGAIYKEPRAPRLDQGYAVGIENAIMWCRNATDDCP